MSSNPSSIRLLALAAWLLATPLVAADPANPPLGLRSATAGPVALVGATVHVSPTRSIENAVLLVRDGRVEAVGAGLVVPADARVIDLTGATIYPGFVDPLTEYGIAPAARGERRGREIQYLRSGEGNRSWNDAVRAERRAAAELAPKPDAARPFLERGVTSVLSIPRDGIFRGRAAVVALADGPLDEELIAADGPHVLAFDKGSSTQAYPSSMMGSIALLRQTLLDAERLHRADLARARGARDPRPAADLAVEALARDLFTSATPPAVLFESADELSLLRAAAVGRELGLPLVHIGSGFEYRRLAEIAALRAPIVLPTRLPKKPDVTTSDAAHDVSLGDLRHWERAPWNAAALAEAGVEIAFTATGAGKDDNFLGTVREAVRHGLPVDTALAALTTVPARIAGVAGEVGTLEPGRRADLVVASGDLLGSADAKIRAVWIGGRLVHEPSPEVLDLRGSWALSIDGQALELEITGEDPAKAKGTARRADAASPQVGATAETADVEATETGDAKLGGENAKTAAPKPATLDGFAATRRGASFRLDLAALGGTGVTRVAILEVGETLEATAELADGRRERATLTRIAPATSAEPKVAEAPGPLLSRQTVPAGSAFGLEAPVAAEDVLVRGATIWTSGPLGWLENADLLVRGGRIAAVGTEVAAPAGVRVIDGAGLHVTAGLIDEHSHLAISSGVNEGTHPVTSEVRIGDVLDPDDVGIWRALAGGTTTMQLLHGSANPIGGQAAVVKLRWGGSAEDLHFEGAPLSIKFALGENVKQSNWDNPGPRYPKTRMGVDERIRDAFLAAKVYRDEHQAFARLGSAEQARRIPPRRDLQLEALVEILDGTRDIHCHSYVQSEILSLLRLGDELGFKVGTLTHILEGYKVAPEIAAHGAGASSFADWWAYKLEVFDAITHNACLLARAGVVTSINSDSAEMIRRLNQEASKSVMACDMDEVAALDMVTINPARQLGIDSRVGSLEVGKDADFVLWNGHPLSTLSRPEQTWVDGRPLFTRERDAGLRSAAAAERHALIQKALASAKPGGNGPSAADRDRRPEWHCDDIHDVWSEEIH